MPIHHTFGPHITWSTVRAASALLLMPHRWQNGPSIEALRDRMARGWEGDAFLFGSGREALLALLLSLDLPRGSEVIIQGYTCIAIPNAITAAGLTPVYADIDPETLNINPASAVAAITPKTRVLLCQHTFGIIADTVRLRSICDAHDLLLVEDCAHVLPDVTGPTQIGKEADFLMLSFGRDKAVSGITGGCIVSRNKEVSSRLSTAEANASPLPSSIIARLLLYPLIYFLAKPLFTVCMGRAFLWVCKQCRLLIPVVSSEEKRGVQRTEIHSMPHACASLALLSHKSLHQMNNRRRLLTKIYKENGELPFPSVINEHMPLQKFPVFSQTPDQIRRHLRSKNIYLDDGWTGSVVCPRTVAMEETGYEEGSCPHAEHVAASILTLPTHPTHTEKEAHRLLTILSSL